MTYDQVESHFGGMKKVMAALRVSSRQTIYNWKSAGVPEPKQFEIEVMTQGKLKAARNRKAA